MAATGPTGPSTPRPSLTERQSLVTKTSERIATDNSATVALTNNKTKAYFSSPQSMRVVHSQANAGLTRDGQVLHGLTLQQGQTTVKVLSPQHFPVGARLTLQSTPSGQLEIQYSSQLKQQLMTEHLQALNRLPAFSMSPSELRAPLTRIIQQIHAIAATQKPTANQMIKTLGDLIQTLKQLNTFELPLTKLDGPHIKDFVTKSGLFLEHQLSHSAPKMVTSPASTDKPMAPATDLKATLHQLTQQLKDMLASTQSASGHAMADAKGNANTRLVNIPHSTLPQTANFQNTLSDNISPADAKLLANSLLNTLKSAPTQRLTGAGLRNAQLISLLRSLAATPPESSGGPPLSASHLAALSVFFGFLAKLSNITANAATYSSQTGGPSQTGWGALFALLFPGPRRLPRTAGKPSTQSLTQQLVQLLSTTQSQLTSLTAKQLWLLNQKEGTSDFKTLLALDLPIQLPHEIQQTPLQISEKHSSASQTDNDSERTWKIELGFDLDHLGLIKTIALYRKGALELTVQNEMPQARDVIITHLQALKDPLAQWGITLDSVTFAPYEAAPQNHYTAQNVLQKIINIEL